MQARERGPAAVASREPDLPVSASPAFATRTRHREPGSAIRWNPPEPAAALPHPRNAPNRRSSSLFRLGGDAISQLMVKKPNENNDTILRLPEA